MRYMMPNPELIGSTYYLRIRVPNDVAGAALGTFVAVPVGDGTVTAKVSGVIKVSLRTKDAAEAKCRFTQALAAVEAHWRSLRKGPVKLNHKQCVALAGELRRDWVTILDEDPGTPEIWQRVKVLDVEAMKPQPSPFAELVVDGAATLSNTKGLESRFGPFVNVALRRHNLLVDDATRARLLPLVAKAMGEAVEINLKKAQGDYSDSGETAKYPNFEVQPAVGAKANSVAKPELTFSDIIDEEVRRRSLGREGKPLPERTVAKFRLAADGFAKYRGSDNAYSVTSEEVAGWKLSLLEERELANNTIAQRLQNMSTVMEWGQQHTLGKLFSHRNPVNLVKRPDKNGVRSEDRTLRLDEARAILRASRSEAKPTLRWLPWMMAYSGARVGEVSQLLAEDFFEAEGEWFYSLTTKGRKSLKNENSMRKVPVHPDLIVEGLLDFVRDARTKNVGRLFKPSAQQDLSDWVRNCVGVTRSDAAPNHGWRHLFEDMAGVGGMSGTAKLYVTGRASGSSADGYGKSDAMLPGLAREMKKIKSYL